MTQREELAARHQVWIALAELFLDNDVTTSYTFIASVLSKSPYTLAELRHILDREVTPALQHNLLSTAGEWAGFRDEWVVEQVTEFLRNPIRLPNLISMSHHWRVLSEMILTNREQSSHYVQDVLRR